MGYLTAPAWIRLNNIISNCLSDSTRFADIYHVDKTHAEKAIRTFTKLKDMAALGNLSARQNIIDYYIRILETQDAAYIDTEIAEAVNFQDMAQNDYEVIFELLLANLPFARIIEIYQNMNPDSYIIEGEEIKQTAAFLEATEHFMQRYQKRREQMNFVCILLYAISYGQSCIESLQYKDVNEIGVLNKDYIYVVYQGLKVRLKFLSFDNAATVINIQKKTTQNSALNFDMQNPIIVTSKNNSSRISVAGYDVTPGNEDFYYNERIFNLNVVSLEEIKEQYHSVNDLMIAFFRYNQKGRGSFIVSGSDMGVGKSTFLLSMIGEYPDYWGIGILDPQNELQAGVKYPNKNVITLVENAKRDLSQSFAYLLKTSRDILVVSEITLPQEVSELVNAALRLNAGVSATMHSLSPKEVVPNLRNMMMKTQMYHDKKTAEEDIAGCIDLIIHLKRLLSGRIVVDSVSEVYVSDPQKFEFTIPEDSCVNNERLIRQQVMRLNAQYLYNQVVGKPYAVKTLIQYDDKSKCGSEWKIVGMPSERYFDKMTRFTGYQYTKQIRDLFHLGR